MTPRQATLLSFLRERALAGDVTPSFDEMAAAIGTTSKGRVAALIEGLESSGHITRLHDRKRAITVTGIDEYQRGYRAGFLAGQALSQANDSIVGDTGDNTPDDDLASDVARPE